VPPRVTNTPRPTASSVPTSTPISFDRLQMNLGDVYIEVGETINLIDKISFTYGGKTLDRSSYTVSLTPNSFKDGKVSVAGNTITGRSNGYSYFDEILYNGVKYRLFGYGVRVCDGHSFYRVREGENQFQCSKCFCKFTDDSARDINYTIDSEYPDVCHDVDTQTSKGLAKSRFHHDYTTFSRVDAQGDWGCNYYMKCICGAEESRYAAHIPSVAVNGKCQYCGTIISSN
jgi:hypothetical protein